MKYKFEDGKVVIEEPVKRPKKITGTRFGAVLKANKWQTPFQAWCEITKAWQKPFEGSIYTEAGKVIEDKQLSWFSRYLDVTRPSDVYGDDFFDRTYGDFFHDESKVFGGMWDGLVGKIGNYTGVIECKTTKRVEDWQNDIPEYYALQASLYAVLLGLDDVYMIVTFLSDSDYEHPEKFECSTDNTAYVHFLVSERYPDFQKYIDYCENFWNENVLGGVSPEYDEKADKEYLDGLRTHVLSDSTDINDLIGEAEELYKKVNAAEESIKADKKRLSEIEGIFKQYAIENEKNGQTKSVFKGNGMSWVVSKTEKSTLDSERLKNDGLYDKYLTNTVQYAIRKTMNKDGEAK